MARIAGDSPGYTFTMMRNSTVEGVQVREPTDYSFVLPSVTTIIKDTLGIPAGAMSWYGFRLGLGGIADVLSDPEATVEAVSNATPEYLEAMLKQRDVNPNVSLSKAGDRGNAAHYVLECLAEGRREEAVNRAYDETKYDETKYGNAVIDWWDSHDGFAGHDIVSERPVWSLSKGYCGTLDLAVRKQGLDPDHFWENPWEVWDLKTHKPASGFTKSGFGPAYISDLIQIDAYASAWNEMNMGQGYASSGGIVIARENGKFLEDTRYVEDGLFDHLIEVFRAKHSFEKGQADG
jgi:hypothetical protein